MTPIKIEKQNHKSIYSTLVFILQLSIYLFELASRYVLFSEIFI